MAKHPASVQRIPDQAQHIRRLSTSVNWEPNGQEIVINFENGKDVRQYPNLWLRDHCQCSECTHPHTKQRQINTFDIATDLGIAQTRPEPSGLRIQWTGSPSGSLNKDHSSFYSWDWLQANYPLSNATTGTQAGPQEERAIRFVDVSDPSSYPTVSYDEVMDTSSSALNRGLESWLTKIRTYGLCFVSDTPPTPAATQALLERIAFIRLTHYGGFWDFTSLARPTDMAYTNLGLAAHTDTTYFTDPCGLQMFHLLSHTDGAAGGESIFVDGFAAARHLYETQPDMYRVLSETRVVSHASGNDDVGSIDNAAAQRGYPVFVHDIPFSSLSPSSSSSSPYDPTHLTQIRWNNDDRSSRTRWPDTQTMLSWYSAAKTWAAVLRDPKFEMEVQLLPGKPVIFDNWRVLHGRRAFTGKRRVCGGYINMDDFLARFRSLAARAS